MKKTLTLLLCSIFCLTGCNPDGTYQQAKAVQTHAGKTGKSGIYQTAKIWDNLFYCQERG